MNDWSKAIVAVATCAAAGTYFTSNANCLWALLIVPILYKAL
jgi:hypothetical protein